jgi:hypothetical protein
MASGSRGTRRGADNAFQSYVASGMRTGPSTISGAGLGVFWQGDRALPPGRRIGVYAGSVWYAPPEDTTYTLQLGPRTYVVADWDPATATGPANWTRWMNDARGTGRPPNAEFTADGRVRTLASVAPGDEVLVDYGEEYWTTRRDD